MLIMPPYRLSASEYHSLVQNKQNLKIKGEIMKKALIRVTFVILALTLMFTLASCKDDDNPSLISTAPEVTTPAPVTDPPVTTPHVHAYAESVVAPTCSKAGYTLHVCVCGDQYLDNETAMLPHTYGAWTTITAATCTTEGEQTRTCTVCAATETQKTAVAGHKYVDVVTAPTKTTQGYTVHTCSVCKHSYTDSYTNATGSVGLAYSQNADGTLTVTGVGLCLDPEIIIYSTTPEGKSVTAIAPGAFKGQTGIKSISLPASIVTIGEGAFAGCTSLTSLTVEADNKYFTSVSNVLYSKDAKTIVCYPAGIQLTSYTIAASITDIRPSAFAGCAYLTEFKLADIVSKTFRVIDGVLYKLTPVTAYTTVQTANELIAYPAGKLLTTFKIPDSVEKIGDYAFYCVTKLTEVTLPDRASSNNIITVPGISTIGAYAFADCPELLTIKLPKITSAVGEYAFSGCLKLRSFTFDTEKTTVTTTVISYPLFSAKLTTIPAHCFENCIALTEIILPDTITTISEYAFNNCLYLSKVVLGSGVVSIKEKAFNFCNSLQYVLYKGDSSSWTRVGVHESNLTTLTIYNNGVTATSKIYFFTTSATNPSGITGYNFWHYVLDVPSTVW